MKKLLFFRYLHISIVLLIYQKQTDTLKYRYIKNNLNYRYIELSKKAIINIPTFFILVKNYKAD